MAQIDGNMIAGQEAKKYGTTVAVAIAGALLALLVHRLWSLEKTSHFIVVLGGLFGLCIAAVFLRRLSDLLLLGLFLTIPVTGFVKTFMLVTAGYSDRDTAILLTSGVIGVGPIDVIIIGLYGLWIYDIFVRRTSSLPTWKWPDVFVVMLLAAYFFSSWGAPEPKAAWFALIFQIRFMLVYFYVSRRLLWRHIPTLVMALCIVAVLESGLAFYQYATGNLVSLALDRGSGTQLHEQYVVPGIEQRNRATGTCNESHGFGLFAGLLAQYLLVWMFNRNATASLRLFSSGAFLLIMLALMVSFSRSAWLSAAITLSLVWFVYFVWGERQLILPTIFAGVIGLFLMPWALTLLWERFSTAEGLVDARFEQYPIAWDIWKDHFLFGYGAGNYMWALDTYNRGGALDLPVHNVFLWIGAEMGLFGVIAYFGLTFGIMGRALRYIRQHPKAVSNLALIVLASLSMTLLDGLTDPLYREPVVYMMFWLTLGIGVALERLSKTEPDNGDSLAANPSPA